MHLETISHGLGAPSQFMFYLACVGKIPARYSFTADTGSEKNRLLQDGSRIGAEEFFSEFVAPMGKRYGVECHFIRSKDKTGALLPSLWDQVKAAAASEAKTSALHIPLFGSQGGRLSQSCTDVWKIRALKQRARELGATTMRSAQGLHRAEMWRRAETRIQKGIVDGFETYGTVDRTYKATTETTGGFDFVTGGGALIEVETTETVIVPVKWLSHYYPIGEGEFAMNRLELRRTLDSLSVPYLITSECDHCPHKDLIRWLHTPKEIIQEIAEVEAMFKGAYFFTDRRKPLLIALEEWKADEDAKKKMLALDLSADDESDFGCLNSHCGV